nr:hypothetical protein [Tanacetum cinerariifolium]
MQELREDTFYGNRNENAHDHVDQVLNNMDRPTLGAVNTWDLLKKAFIQRYCPPSKIATQLEDTHNLKQESDESVYQACERKHFKKLSLDESRSPDFDLFYDQEEYSKEEVAKTIEQYMSKTRADYGSRVARPRIEHKDNFELKGQYLKELRSNTFSGSDHEDANEHIEKVLKIVDLFHIPNINIYHVILRAFRMPLTRAASRWLRNKPSGSITTWGDLKMKFLSKYCPPTHTAKKMKEINNFQKEPNENLYQAWETRSTKTSNGLAAIQAQLNNLGREIKKVNEKVYAAQVGCEQCKGPHYTKDCPLKEEGKTLEDAYYTQFGLYTDVREKTNDNSVSREFHFTLLYNALGDLEASISVCFDNALGLEASVSVMPLSTYLNLGLGELAHTKLTVELADMTMKYLKGIVENVLVAIGTFSVVTDFTVLEDMDVYRDEGIGDVIFGEPFLREVRIKARRFDGMITIYNGNESVTYQMVRSHPRFKNHTKEQ